MSNKYTGITKYYDLLMQSGYYDHKSLAKSALPIVGKSRQVLEIGVGTGLLAQQYIEIDPGCKFTGIDFTPSMLEIAKDRLDDGVELIEADVLEMDLEKTFDAIVSCGGVWVIIDSGDCWEIGSHMPDTEVNRKGLVTLAHHLRQDGLLLLNRQPQHQNFDKPLPNGITYSQFIEEGEDKGDYYTLYKNYFFKQGEEILAEERLTLVFFKPDVSRQLFDEAGFDFQESDNENCWAIYKKR